MSRVVPKRFVPALLLAAALGASCDSGADSGGDPEFPQSARVFFLSPNGDDDNPGTDPNFPWRTLGRASRHTFPPGALLRLEGGATFTGTLRLDAADGADPPGRQSPEALTVDSVGPGGPATIDAGEGSGIVATDLTRALIIGRLNIVGGWRADEQTGNDGEGVSVVGTVIGERRIAVQLLHLDVSGFKHAGIGIHARPSDDSKESGYNSVLIHDSVVHDNGDAGITIDGPYVHDRPGHSHSGVQIRRVRVHHNRGLKNKGEHTGSGIVVSDVSSATIEYSIAHDNGEFNDHESGGGFGIWAWDSKNVTIQFNESYRNKSMTADGGGFDLDGGVTNSVMQFNYSHDNAGAGFGAFQFPWARPFENNVVRYNISQNDGVGFLVWDGNGDLGSLDFAHNVAYGKAPALATYSALADVTFANNVFYGTGSQLLDVEEARGLRLLGNAYWAGGAPLTIGWGSETFDALDAFRAATNQETWKGSATGVFADPRLIAAGEGPVLDDADLLSELEMYKLASDSPLVDRGVALRELGIEQPELTVGKPRDFFDGPAPRGAGPDIGVHELR